MNLDELNKIARSMVAPGKGILAADESTGTIKKRFDAIGVESPRTTAATIASCCSAPTEGDEEHISGVILYDETIRQKAKDGTPLVKLIEAGRRACPASRSTRAPSRCRLPGRNRHRRPGRAARAAAEYHELGARFAKWRAVIDIGAGIPTYNCINANAHALARYAALCQEARHRADRRAGSADGRRPRHRPLRARSPSWVLKKCSRSSTISRVALEGMVLKPNMVDRRARSARKQAGVEEVAEKTVKVLKDCVPSAVPGIAFLSGGQSDEEATAHLDAMNKIGGLPWKLTFSYGRALQAAPQKAWSGKTENVAAAQRAFAHRARMNGLAALGQWKADLEKKACIQLACTA